MHATEANPRRPAAQEQPIEKHEPIPDDKLFLTPSPRRPLRRDLERLVARWEGWR